MWSVVGLGNPGRKYRDTRHNVGFLFVKRVAREWGARIKKKKYSSKVAVAERGGEKVMLTLPQTYMNRSGWAVKQMVQEGGFQPHKMVVVYDDLDLTLGTIRIRREGSAGSHKGMKSIVQEVGTNQFPRIRIGVGPADPRMDAAEYVLSPFSKEERRRLEKSLEEAEKALMYILKGEDKKAMNLYNKRMSGPV
ncbi:aminoacyl-tRNA hydrolase [bacterium]|nr:aminoacyl-tRNA hydrolase [bacterium]